MNKTGSRTHVVLLCLLVLGLSWSSHSAACCDANDTSGESDVPGNSAGHDVMALAKPNPVVTAVTQQAMEADAAKSFSALAKTQFVKIADNGRVAADNDADWECVHDSSNELTWEVKKNDGGIRDRDNTYSWQQGADGRFHGVSDGGRCTGGIDCDTSSYVRAMNELQLCGFSDWRLPSREELETLVEHNNKPASASIDTGYFPQSIPSWYWSATENSKRESYAWYVLFQNGIALNDLKERPKHIRLVRGNQAK